MKIVADENIPLVNEFFGHLGDVICLPGRSLRFNDIEDADALIVRSVTNVNSALLTGSNVKFVGTCTIGVDHLDQAYLSENGIPWFSAPGCNANSVVEFVYAALCHLDVNWLPMNVGIIGCGNVGGLLYRRLKAQGVNVRCYDPNLSQAQNPDLTTLDDVLACDVISMHTPLVKAEPHPSFHLLGYDELSRLKSGAVLLNCGRGAVIDNQALLQLLNERSDLNVVLDVWEPEPTISLPLLDKVVLGSPHIAGHSYDGKLNGTHMIYKALCHHLAIDPLKSLTAVIPSLAHNELQLPLDNLNPGKTIFEHVKTLIKQVYDIAGDDARLRALAKKSRSGEADFGDGFDALRKHYPIRREFHNYRVNISGISDDEKKWLQVLGFNCV